MVSPATRAASYAEYVASERASDTKHEYRDGLIVAMAGGSIEHGRLQAAFQALLRSGLRDAPCVVLSSDVRVRVVASNRAFYPDGFVVCGRIERAEDDADAVVNPTLVVEVLSDSSEGYDRGEKPRHYRQIESLREYVLVSQSERLVEVWEPAGRSWTTREYGSGETVELRSIGVRIDVDELYANPLAARNG
jgi:Uma2 family endonuclease